MSSKSTRFQILEYLAEKHSSTPLEMALALHLTPANIRHHISILEKEGAIVPVGARRASLRGRSSRVFSLRSESTTHNLDILASALLNENPGDPEDRPAYLRRVAIRMSIASNAAPGASTKRLVGAVNRLNEMKYQARWEARSDAPRVILGHCPYAALLPDHPEVCQIDAYLLEEMLGRTVVKTAHLELTPQGLRQCVFVVNNK